MSMRNLANRPLKARIEIEVRIRGDFNSTERKKEGVEIETGEGGKEKTDGSYLNNLPLRAK